MMLLCAGIFLLTGCSSPKNITYIQDTAVGVEQPVAQRPEFTARPGDRIMIVVSCADPQTAAIFNLMTPSMRLRLGENASPTNDGNLSSYLVDERGNIDFPVLGSIHVAGLTTAQISNLIKNELVQKQYVKDPVVLVDFTNLHYNVVGEVARPGQYQLTNNRVSLLEAISQAGDLTIFGRRDNVKIIREQNGKRVTYEVDLRNTHLYDSPAYYLQQNDVIYVEPNSLRAGQSTANENVFKQPGFWMSAATFLMSITVLIVK